MNETMIAPTWRAQIADPKPAFCTGCLRGADAGTTFVEIGGMPSGRGHLREFGSMAIIADLNRLCLCESCVHEMAEALAFNPELHRAQRAQLEVLVSERDRLEKENVMLRSLVSAGLVEEQPSAEEKKSGARRK
jgi:hypothetical protein